MSGTKWETLLGESVVTFFEAVGLSVCGYFGREAFYD